MKKLIIILFVLAVLALVGYGYYSPYRVANRFAAAVQAQKADVVSGYMDSDSVKASVQDQIQGVLTAKMLANPAIKDNPMSVIALSIVPQLAGGMAEVIASPIGVIKILGGVNPLDKSSADVSKPLEATRLSSAKRHYLDFNHFVMILTQDKYDDVQLVFERKRLISWKMKKIVFPKEFFDQHHRTNIEDDTE